MNRLMQTLYRLWLRTLPAPDRRRALAALLDAEGVDLVIEELPVNVKKALVTWAARRARAGKRSGQ